MSSPDTALDYLKAWDPEWAALYERVAVQPWRAGVLTHKVSALILVALNASCTARNTDGTRTSIRAALQAGATRDEVLAVLKMAALLAVHSCSLGAPLLLAELPAAHDAEGAAAAGRHSRVRRHARDGPVEHGLGPILQP